MAAYVTIQQLVADVRILLQDTIEPYRYPDPQVVLALNTTMRDARRLRPDLFMKTALTTYTDADGTEIKIDPMYIPAVTFGVVGNIQFRDGEDTQDPRAADFMRMFVARLISVNT